MSQVERKRLLKRMTGKQIRGMTGSRRSREPEAAWQFLQNLVLVGLIRPRSEELKRIILASPPAGPRTP